MLFQVPFWQLSTHRAPLLPSTVPYLPVLFLHSPLTRADCLPNVISRELGDSGSLQYRVVPHLWTTIKLSIPELTVRVALLVCGDQRVPQLTLSLSSFLSPCPSGLLALLCTGYSANTDMWAS